MEVPEAKGAGKFLFRSCFGIMLRCEQVRSKAVSEHLLLEGPACSVTERGNCSVSAIGIQHKATIDVQVIRTKFLSAMAFVMYLLLAC